MPRQRRPQVLCEKCEKRFTPHYSGQCYTCLSNKEKFNGRKRCYAARKRNEERQRRLCLGNRREETVTNFLQFLEQLSGQQQQQQLLEPQRRPQQQQQVTVCHSIC
ncbi:hypothetical protein QOT17_012914 [Balamuthia mandrillaris]